MPNGLLSFNAARPSDTSELAQTLYKTPALVRHGVRCGKASCRCQGGDPHGPYAFLYWREGVVQRRRYVRQADVAAVRAVIEWRQRDEQKERQVAALAIADLRRLRAWLRELEQG